VLNNLTKKDRKITEKISTRKRDGKYCMHFTRNRGKVVNNPARKRGGIYCTA
jgi:hypothetical protein